MISLLIPLAVQIATQQAVRTNMQTALQSSYMMQQRAREHEREEAEERRHKEEARRLETKMPITVVYEKPFQKDGHAVNRTGYWSPNLNDPIRNYTAKPADIPETTITRIPSGLRYVAGVSLDEPMPWYKQWWAIALASLIAAIVGAIALGAVQDNEDFTYDD